MRNPGIAPIYISIEAFIFLIENTRFLLRHDRFKAILTSISLPYSF